MQNRHPFHFDSHHFSAKNVLLPVQRNISGGRCERSIERSKCRNLTFKSWLGKQYFTLGSASSCPQCEVTTTAIEVCWSMMMMSVEIKFRPPEWPPSFSASSVWPDGYIIFFNIWPFVTMTVCPIALKNAQIGFNILLNNKEILKQLSKTFKMLSIWWNFTKSGHTFWQVLGDPFKRFEVSLSSAKYFQTKWSPLSDKFSRLQLMTSKYFKFSCWHLLADTGFRHFCKSILKWRVVTETPTQKFVFRIEKTPGN